MSVDVHIKAFKDQVWEELRHEYNSDNLFEDPEFPAVAESVYYSKSLPRGVQWRRPRDVFENPQFFIDHFDRADLDQGQLGNCWFIAACVGLLQVPKCLAKVVPTDQGYNDNYGGIFHFRFWQYGEWVDVVIDDLLPFTSDGRLVFCSNKTEPNELWGPLLEKAYAKLYGAYEALDGGFTTDALIDMCGGIEEGFDLTKMDSKQKQDLWTVLLQAYTKNSIIGCSINADPAVKEARLANGLVRGHAYTITKVVNINVNGSDVNLIRCRNPWGNEVEWNGAWSDKSYQWRSVSDDQKQELGLVVDADGEFWMQFSDFIKNWHTIQICHLSVDSFSSELLEADQDSDLNWKCTTHHSKWEVGHTAGGCGQPNMAKFWTNPQFHIKLVDIDHDDNENMATIIVALMQKDTRLKRRETGGDAAEEYIQFRLFKIKDGVHIDENMSSGLKFYSNQLERIGTSGSYINMREVTKRFRVPPGEYIIIPSTYDEDKDCEFMLRLFTEHLVENNTLETDKDELNDEDVFFEQDDSDNIFNNWTNLIGGGGDQGDGFFSNASKNFEQNFQNFGERFQNFNQRFNEVGGGFGHMSQQFSHYSQRISRYNNRFASNFGEDRQDRNMDVKGGCSQM